MARYIDAVNGADIISTRTNIPLDDLVDVFAEIPTADVEEVKHGYWRQNQYCKRVFYCSECNRHIEDATQIPQEHFPYCHCGAKMDGGKGE